MPGRTCSPRLHPYPVHHVLQSQPWPTSPLSSGRSLPIKLWQITLYIKLCLVTLGLVLRDHTLTCSHVLQSRPRPTSISSSGRSLLAIDVINDTTAISAIGPQLQTSQLESPVSPFYTSWPLQSTYPTSFFHFSCNVWSVNSLSNIAVISSFPSFGKC